jgi:hypothetical protein
VLNSQPTIYIPSGSTSLDNLYLQFTDESSSIVVVTPDGCNCVANYTIPVPNIVDPYTNQIGYGCQLTELGVSDLALGTSGILYNTYLSRQNGKLTCSGVNN